MVGFNLLKYREEFMRHYDFVIVGAGSSGRRAAGQSILFDRFPALR